MEMKTEIEELQGSSKGSTALHGSCLDLSDTVQLSEVRQPVMRTCLLPAFPPQNNWKPKVWKCYLNQPYNSKVWLSSCQTGHWHCSNGLVYTRQVNVPEIHHSTEQLKPTEPLCCSTIPYSELMKKFHFQHYFHVLKIAAQSYYI